MRVVKCSKCGEEYSTPFCPVDGTKLQEDPGAALIEDLEEVIKKGYAFLTKNANSEDAKIQKGLPTRRAKLERQKMCLEWVKERVLDEQTRPGAATPSETPRLAQTGT